MEATIKKGASVNLDIESLAFGGRGVAKANGYVIFVEGTIPGQQVQAIIVRKRKGYAEARVLDIIKKSPEEVEPRCRHFGECGGCRLQNLAYGSQLKYKREQVIESLEHLGGFVQPPVEATLPSPDQFYYRNKMEFSFGQNRWLPKSEIDADNITKPRNFALGLHVRGRFDKILDLDACYLQSIQTFEILDFVRQFVLQSGSQPYSTADHSGFWRHLVIREGKNTGDSMVNLVTAEIPEHNKKVDELALQLTQRFKSLTTIVHNINRRKAQVATGDEERILVGEGTIKEKIGDCVFQISANSFFQTNTRGAELLYDKVIEFADLKEDEIVYDLYSGAGTISLSISNRVQKVVGFELIKDAIQDAEHNCQINAVKNCQFVEGNLKDSLSNRTNEFAKWGRPDTLIIDPPRPGMHADVLDELLKIHPEKIVYVSCNPTTFARDAKTLCAQKYELSKVQPVDMFPMTAHVELVSLLKGKGF